MAAPVIEAANKLKAGLLARERQAATRLVRAYGRIYSALQEQIKALLAEMQALDSPTRGQLVRMARLKALQAQIVDEIASFGTIVENEAALGARAAIEQALRDSRRLTQLALPGITEIDAQIMARWNRLPVDAIEEALAFLGEGSPLQARWAKQVGEEVAESVGNAMVEGVALGWNPKKIARDVRDRFGQGLDWALRNARTSQLWAYREASRASYMANAHIIKGWTWVSALDDRTCMACIAMHGSVHPLTEPLIDHYNGRCTAVPNTVTYRDLGLAVGGPEQEIESGAAWFAKQTEATQRKMMGGAKYDAWRAGKISLGDLTTTREDPVYGPMLTEQSLKGILGDGAREFYGGTA